MKHLLTSFAYYARRFAKDDNGYKAIDFVWVFPFIVYIFFAAGEIGTLAARSVLLERGLDIAMREVRLGIIPDGLTAEQAHERIKWRVCKEAFLLSNCMDDLLLSMTATDLGGDIPRIDAACRDKAADAPDPVLSIDRGSRADKANTQIMLVRACLPVKPIFPGTGIGAGLPKDPQGNYQIMLESAFLNEPE